MAEFQLDTAGVITMHEPAFAYLQFTDLDAFTQGYVEAAFFTENAQGVPRDCEWAVTENGLEFKDDDGDWVVAEGAFPADFGFADLAPETLAAMIADCAAFQARTHATRDAAQEVPGYGPGEERGPCDDEHAGRDFWYTRNGHGCGFWDGDWPEPYASELTAAAKAFGEVSLILGDDGKIHCE